MDYEHIPQDIKVLDRWVCIWNNSKVPMQARTRKGASSVNPETWCDFETAKNSVENGTYDNIGFVFNGDGIIGIDLDAGFDEDGFLSSVAIDCMTSCGSYTEKSRSGRGIHILVKGTLPFKGKNNHNGVEIYGVGRYFIVTGKKLVYDTIIENQKAIDYIIEKYFPEEEKESASASSQRIYSPIYEKPVDGKISLKPKYPEILPGMRNLSLTSLAGQLHTQGYNKKEIYKELLYANQQACKPPLSEGEVQTIVNSVSRYKR